MSNTNKINHPIEDPEKKSNFAKNIEKLKEDPEKNRRKFIIDPLTITKQQQKRMEQWAAEIMKKNEHKLDRKKYKHQQVVTSNEIKPEDIAIKQIYPIEDLNWLIYRHIDKKKDLWVLMLRSKGRVLLQAGFAKI